MIKQDGDSYQTSHGQDGGKMQFASDTPGDKGKPNTKAYVDPIANCEFHVSREIRKKTEKGYIRYIDGKATEEQITEIKWDEHLPKNFCSFKPRREISDKQLLKIHKSGFARYSRKLNGQAHIVVHHTFGWEIYSRRIDLVTDKFPNHIAKLKRLNFGVGTILVGEMACIGDNKIESLKAMSRISNSLPNEARDLINSGEVFEPRFVVYDILFFNKLDLSNHTYDDRSEIWLSHGVCAMSEAFDSLVVSVDYQDIEPDTWEDIAKEKGWEGYVLVDGSSKPGDKFYSFNGKPERPKGHYKLKPVYEADVVIFAAGKGTGKRLGKVGKVYVKQMHPDTGEWVELGKCGSGFTDEDIEEFGALCVKHDIPILSKDKEINDLDINREDGLLVAEIEYASRFSGTNKFEHAVFIRLRNDKGVEECDGERWRYD
jgi:DNA ligase-1